jgi:hypothetical protein
MSREMAVIALMMEAVRSFETSVTVYETTRHSIREDKSHLHKQAYTDDKGNKAETVTLQ